MEEVPAGALVVSVSVALQSCQTTNQNAPNRLKNHDYVQAAAVDVEDEDTAVVGIVVAAASVGIVDADVVEHLIHRNWRLVATRENQYLLDAAVVVVAAASWLAGVAPVGTKETQSLVVAALPVLVEPVLVIAETAVLEFLLCQRNGTSVDHLLLQFRVLLEHGAVATD